MGSDGIIPAGLYRGIERSTPTVVRSGTVIYERDDMPDNFAYADAKAMDEQQAREVPLHLAPRYYKGKGYMKWPDRKEVSRS